MVTEYPIDKLIQPAVTLLQDYGFNTIESCEGGKGHASLEPMVRFIGDELDIIRAIDICTAHKMTVIEGRKVYKKIQDIIMDGNWQKPLGQTFEKPTNYIIFYIHPLTGTIFFPD